MIDNTTQPKCDIQIKYFEWGEPYESFIPLFEIFEFNGNTLLENSINFYGKNNFKNQLLVIYNLILNNQEDEIINFHGVISNREELLNLLNFYINDNKNKVAPWEKYSDSINEIDYVKNSLELIKFHLCYSNPRSA
jgi:hypothetical protein